MFYKQGYPNTFLGANSGGGFVSYFANCYSAKDGYKVFILKGGPGTGKSTLMKKIADYFINKGENVEFCPCSSDPNSLDGVIIKSRKAVVLDGTAPHTVEPVYPGVCEKVINLLEYEGRGFSENPSEIIDITNKNKALHRTASRYITAAAECLEDNYRLAEQATDKNAVIKEAKRICKKLIKNGEKGKTELRFLTGITPEGVVSFEDTVTCYADRVIVLEDKYASVSETFLQAAAEQLKENNIGAIICKNTFNSKHTDHIIIPSLRFALCRQYDCFKCDFKEKSTIHARRFIKNYELAQHKNQMKFNARIYKETLKEAVSTLRKAKAVHDELEKYYIDTVDFNRADRITDSIISQIEGI